VNFKVQPMPEVERSFLLPFDSLAAAIAARNVILKGQLQPSAIDLLNPAAARTLGKSTWLLALRAGGNAAAVERYEREFANFADALAFENDRQQTLWCHLENFTPQFLASYDDGVVVRISCTLKEAEAVVDSFPGPAVARAGSGVCYGYFERSQAARDWLSGAQTSGCKAVIEFAFEEVRRTFDLWPAPGGDFEIMKRVKQLFDPRNLLNRGRLYRLI
jgi:glycolate oxidase FAD binding subunit